MDANPHYVVKTLLTKLLDDAPGIGTEQVQTLLNDMREAGFVFALAVPGASYVYFIFQRVHQCDPAAIQAQELAQRREQALMDQQMEMTELAKENLLRQRVREEAHLAACPVCQQHGAGDKGQ